MTVFTRIVAKTGILTYKCVYLSVQSLPCSECTPSSRVYLWQHSEPVSQTAHTVAADCISTAFNYLFLNPNAWKATSHEHVTAIEIIVQSPPGDKFLPVKRVFEYISLISRIFNHGNNGVSRQQSVRHLHKIIIMESTRGIHLVLRPQETSVTFWVAAPQSTLFISYGSAKLALFYKTGQSAVPCVHVTPGCGHLTVLVPCTASIWYN